MTPPSTAQDFDAGWAALRAGDYETALSHLEPLALVGDDRAMVGMGYLYSEWLCGCRELHHRLPDFPGRGGSGQYAFDKAWTLHSAIAGREDARARHHSAVERWGSVSIRVTFSPRIAAYTARCTARVALPAPPF